LIKDGGKIFKYSRRPNVSLKPIYPEFPKPIPIPESVEEREERLRQEEELKFDAEKRALQREYELKMAHIQHQYEVDKFKRSLRGKELSSDLEDLAHKIKNAKQFEQEAIRMVEGLKADGNLDPEEERILRELIKDKVMEEFHVDRRGGRSRSFS